MLGSSVGVPTVTVIQGNLKVNGGISATSSIAPSANITGNLTVGGTATVTGQITANGGLAVQSGNLSVSPGISNLSSVAASGTLNVAGSGVIGTPSTSTSLTVYGNVAQSNTAAANTFNGQSNAFSGSVTVGGGAGPGAGSVTAAALTVANANVTSVLTAVGGLTSITQSVVLTASQQGAPFTTIVDAGVYLISLVETSGAGTVGSAANNTVSIVVVARTPGNALLFPSTTVLAGPAGISYSIPSTVGGAASLPVTLNNGNGFPVTIRVSLTALSFLS